MEKNTMLSLNMFIIMFVIRVSLFQNEIIKRDSFMFSLSNLFVHLF